MTTESKHYIGCPLLTPKMLRGQDVEMKCICPAPAPKVSINDVYCCLQCSGPVTEKRCPACKLTQDMIDVVAAIEDGDIATAKRRIRDRIALRLVGRVGWPTTPNQERESE